jgi:hypothetical protein
MVKLEIFSIGASSGEKNNNLSKSCHFVSHCDVALPLTVQRAK